MRDPAPRSSSAAAAAGERTLQSRVMTEMRQHLIRINREKMMERGATGLTEREAALLGKYSSLHGLATMELASEHTGSSGRSEGSSRDSGRDSSDTSRLWRELMY